MRFAFLVAGSLWMCGACAPAPRWIAVAAGREVRLYDAALRPLTVFALPAEPRGLEFNGEGNGIVVGGLGETGSGWLGWISRLDGGIERQQPIPDPLGAVALEREGRRLFALTTGGAAGPRLTIADAATLLATRAVPLCGEPLPPTFTKDGELAYVVCQPGTVAEVDLRLGMVVRRAVVAGDSGRACRAGPAALSANETLLLLPCAASGRLLYLDRVTLRPWDSLDVAAGMARVIAAPRGRAAVLLPDSDRVAILDLRAKRRVASVPTAPGPVDLALDASGQMAFVLAAGRSGSAGGLLEISLRDGTVLGQASLPAGGRAVAVWPGRHKVRMAWVRASASGAPAARW